MKHLAQAVLGNLLRGNRLGRQDCGVMRWLVATHIALRDAPDEWSCVPIAMDNIGSRRAVFMVLKAASHKTQI